MVALLWSSIAYGHAGEGDPIFARVELPDQEMYAGDSMKVVFHVFDLKAVESGEAGEPIAQAEVTAMIEKGDKKITVVAEEENGQYVAIFQFPEAGKWQLSAHVERAETHHHNDNDHDHDDNASFEPHDKEDASYYETTIKVRNSIEKIISLWAWWVIGFTLMVGLILFILFRKKCRSR